MNLLQVDATVAAINQGNIWLEKIKGMALEYAPKVLGAIIVYFIGSWLIKKIGGAMKRVFSKRNFDTSLQNFLISTVKALLTVLLLLAITSMLGVDITSFAALLAGAGLAIGAALNGSLGNLAGGVMIMIFKPFKIDDIIEAQGATGVVKEIGIFCTTVLTPENKTVILPNGGLSTGVITNYNTHGNLRVDITMAIALDMNIDQAREIATAAMLTHPKVLGTPAPEVNVLKVGDGMVQLAVRPYTTQSDYWDVFFGVQERVKKAFDANGIAGPIPTRVIINK
jgi:small conductance mechanosensitive channel